MSTIRLLAAADIHIGRRPTQVDSGSAEAFSTAQAWAKLVQCAIEQKVAAVLLAGDIVDEQNKFFEALGPFEAGLKELATAQIPVLAVAGNHDFDVLADIADAVKDDNFRLIGRGGNWECFPLRQDGKVVMQIVGWSFPRPHVAQSPLLSFSPVKLKFDPTLPVVGLLHADLDAAAGNYAPVTRNEFAATEIPLWILGHLHNAFYHTSTDGISNLLYPGSLQGLDPGPGETGQHGPWIITLQDGQATPDFLPLAGLVYDDLEIGLDQVGNSSEVRQNAAAAVKDKIEELQGQNKDLERVFLRLHVNGRCNLSATEVHDCLKDAEETGLEVGAVQVQLQLQDIELRPVLDLEQLADEQTLPGELARLIQELEAGTEVENPAATELLSEMMDAIREIRSSAAFALLNDSLQQPVEPGETRHLALEQAWQLLDALCRQREKDNA